MSDTADASHLNSNNSFSFLDDEEEDTENIQTSNYITASDLNSFCNFERINNITVLHITCRSMKKTLIHS
jgi:hypothetical protein